MICYVFCIPSFSQPLEDHEKVELYLNSIKTLRADLIQLSSNGEVETGKLFIKKPGQMRFQYDPPSNHLVMASGLFLVVIDRKSTAEPQRYFTSQTPIGHLLTESIKFDENSTLKKSFVKDGYIHIFLYDKKNQRAGVLELIFSQNPLALKEWIITTHSGEQVRTLLEKLEINKPINKTVFNISHEISKAKRAQTK